MSKSKKKTTPKIDPRALARPRLDALFDRRARGELDLDGLLAGVQALMADIGSRPVLDALLKRLEAAPPAEREVFMTSAGALGSPDVSAYLWQQAKHPGHSTPLRSVSLGLLRAMGDDADPDHPEQYVPAAAKPTQRALAPLPSPYPPPPPRTPEQIAADERWEQFKGASLTEEITLFESAVAAGTLDDDEAFDMLDTIRAGLDPRRNPENRARYACLVEKLRQAAPALYRHSAGYYLENLIVDALDDDRWEALPDLLLRFAAEAPDEVDRFFRMTDALLYYGQTRSLLAAVRVMRPAVAASPKLIPGADDELAARALLWGFYDYVATAAAPRAADPALRALEAEFGEYNAAWLEHALHHLTTPTTWTLADFGEAADAEQWEENMRGLLFEFMAEAHRQGVPFSKSALARELWYEVLHQQMTMGQPSSPTAGQGKKKKPAKRGPAGPRTVSPLIPERSRLDRACADHFHFLAAQPHTVAATLELLPDYLRFIARRGLLARPELEAALAALGPLAQQVETLLDNYGGDPRPTADVAATWAEARLAELVRDPAVPETVAAPPPAPPPPQPRPGAHLTYTFKVAYRPDPNLWRTVELTVSQTLRELHAVILDAFDFDYDHLYSFFMSGEAWDKASEYAAHPEGSERGVSVTLGSLHLRPRQKFLYLYDYGDQHEFDVQLVGVNPDAPKGRYPKIIETHGKPPAQYGDWDGDEAEDHGWDDDDGDAEGDE